MVLQEDDSGSSRPQRNRPRIYTGYPSVSADGLLMTELLYASNANQLREQVLFTVTFPWRLIPHCVGTGDRTDTLRLCSSGNMVSSHLFSQKVMSSPPPTPIRGRDGLKFASWHRIVMDSSMAFQLLQLCYDITGARWI